MTKGKDLSLAAISPITPRQNNTSLFSTSMPFKPFFATGRSISTTTACLKATEIQPRTSSQTAEHYIAAKQPFELAVLQSTIPFTEWNSLDNVIASKIPTDNAGKPWIWLQKLKEHHAGTSTLMQDRYH